MDITIYSTPTCVYCRTLKEYLKRNKIAFKETDVTKDEKELEKMIKISGQMGVPVVEIGDNVVVGFDKKRIDELLGLGAKPQI